MQDVSWSLFALLLAASAALDFFPSLRLRTRILTGLALSVGALAAIFWGVYLPISPAAADIFLWICGGLFFAVIIASIPRYIAEIRAAARE